MLIFVKDQKNIVKRKYILEIIFKYIYNDGMKVNFEPTILLYLENLIDFLINLDYKVNLKKKKTMFSVLLYYIVLIINFYVGCFNCLFASG